MRGARPGASDGRNYDYSEAFALLRDDVAVTVYHPADGSLAVATVGYVGEIYAVNGLNEKGIFMELNNGKPSADIKSPDTRVTGTTMLFSALFEIDELDDWDLFFRRAFWYPQITMSTRTGFLPCRATATRSWASRGGRI